MQVIDNQNIFSIYIIFLILQRINNQKHHYIMKPKLSHLLMIFVSPT